MRFRLAVILTLLAGVIALLLVAGRKSSSTEPTSAYAGSNRAAQTTQSAFRKAAKASSFTRVSAESAEASSPATVSNFFQRMMSGEIDGQLTSEQVAEYLRQYGTNVETLLGSNRRDLWKQAAELFPNDPRVQFAVLNRDLFPEERRQWLDRFKESAPDNALANYLSARDYLRAGNREQALEDIKAATTKSRFNDYTSEQIQFMEESQLSAGRSVAEAKVAAASGTVLGHLAMLKGLSQDLQAMQKEYIGAGDMATAQALAKMGQTLGQQLSAGEGSRFLINQLVGVAIQRNMLSVLPPDSQPDFLSGTVQQRLDELAVFRQTVKTLTPLAEQVLERGDEAEITSYYDRLKLQGEYKTLLWLQNRQNLR